MTRRGYYPAYWHNLTRLTRDVLEAHVEDWMPEGDDWEAVVKDFAQTLDSAIGDRLHEWLIAQEQEHAERKTDHAMDLMVPR